MTAATIVKLSAPGLPRGKHLRYRVHGTNSDGTLIVWGPLTPREDGWVDHPKARYRNIHPNQIVETP